MDVAHGPPEKYPTENKVSEHCLQFPFPIAEEEEKRACLVPCSLDHNSKRKTGLQG